MRAVVLDAYGFVVKRLPDVADAQELVALVEDDALLKGRPYSVRRRCDDFGRLDDALAVVLDEVLLWPGEPYWDEERAVWVLHVRISE